MVDATASSVGAKDLVGRSEADLSFFFGGAPGKAGFSGGVDRVSVWARPLALDELWHLAQGAPPVRGRASGLLGLWTFAEAAGRACYDTHLPAGAKGVALDGSLQGEGADGLRAPSARGHAEPDLVQSERFMLDKADELAEWRAGFGRRNLRPPTKADLLMAESSVLELARLLGEV